MGDLRERRVRVGEVLDTPEGLRVYLWPTSRCAYVVVTDSHAAAKLRAAWDSLAPKVFISKSDVKRYGPIRQQKGMIR